MYLPIVDVVLEQARSQDFIKEGARVIYVRKEGVDAPNFPSPAHREEGK
jgi:hypothetical protein